MNTELLGIIAQYQNAVSNLFPKVAKHLNILLPITNTEWVGVDAEQRGETKDGIKYFMHGYGIDMTDGNIRVDFDLGEKGEINGFDAWRLSKFLEDNNIESSFVDDKEIEKELKEAEESGEIIYSGYILYYLK